MQPVGFVAGGGKITARYGPQWIDVIPTSLKGETGNLRRAAQPPGKYNRADAPAHIDLRVSEAIPTDFETQLLRSAAVHRAQQRQIHLPAVRMAGKHQADAMIGCSLHEARIVPQ